MEDVYMKAKLIEPSDRVGNSVVEIRTTQGHIERVYCSTYDISEEKADTEQILHGLSIEYNRIMDETSSYKEKELINKIFGIVEECIKFYQ